MKKLLLIPFLLLMNEVYCQIIPALPVILAKPEMPYGISSLCNFNSDTRYTIHSVKDAESYTWSLIPETAGTLTAKDTSVIINFSEEYSGIAKLSVVAISTLGISPSSDALSITIDKIADQPEIPMGDSIVCQGTTNLPYYIHAVSGTEKYLWSFNPLESSTVSNIDTMATLKIYADYIGQIQVFVAIKNTCGTSLNSEAKTIEVIKAPLAPSIPKGDTMLCANEQMHKFYTNGSNYATHYIWSMFPDTAASLLEKNDTIYAIWNQHFRKNFQIKVKAENSCGVSDYSQTFNGYIYIVPPKPGLIIGNERICSGTDYTTYKIDSVDEATQYHWYIYPPTSADMEGITKAGNAYWSTSFLGNTNIYVTAQNQCGISSFSDSLKVLLLAKPESTNKPSGVDEMCVNEADMSYATTTSTNATSYEWIIVPTSAGVMSGNSAVATMNWDNNYMGNVKIAVRGVNECGKSPSSDSLLVVIREQLYAQFSYQQSDKKISFTNESFPELKLNSFLWNFGDASASTSINPEHIYAVDGAYSVTLIISNPYCVNDTSQQNITLNSNSIETQNYIFDQNFELYPNPVSDFLTIKNKSQQSNNYTIKILDLTGKIIYLNKKQELNEAYKINLKFLKNGIYYVLLQSSKDTFVKKIIKN
jgi:PKD repeat protein